MFVHVQDHTDATRVADVESDTVGALVGGWLIADGGKPSHNVNALEAALRRRDWASVHRIADHLSLSVEVL